MGISRSMIIQELTKPRSFILMVQKELIESGHRAQAMNYEIENMVK